MCSKTLDVPNCKKETWKRQYSFRFYLFATPFFTPFSHENMVRYQEEKYSHCMWYNTGTGAEVQENKPASRQTNGRAFSAMQVNKAQSALSTRKAWGGLLLFLLGQEVLTLGCVVVGW